MKKLVSHGRLLEVIDYEPETGTFTWLNRERGYRPGTKAGTVRGGYLHIMIDGIDYSAHRLAWFYSTQKWPKQDIDHIDQDKLNNRLLNLRDVSRSENNRNKACWRQGEYTGVTKSNSLINPWRASIRVNGKLIHLGSFSTKEAASSARHEFVLPEIETKKTKNLLPLTCEKLKQIVFYDEQNGLFYKRETTTRTKSGAPIGVVNKNSGYCMQKIEGKSYSSHRLAWFYVYGVWPSGVIDHIDGIKTNNKIANLRDVSKRENSQNRKCHRDGRVAGVTFRSDLKKPWVARIKINGATKTLGTFLTQSEARNAYLSSCEEMKIPQPEG